MAFDPVVVEFNAPKTPLGRFRDKLPHLSTRGQKIMIAFISAVMIISMVSFAVFTVQSNDANFAKKHGLDANLPQTSGVDKNAAALPGGGVAVGIGGTTGKNAPEITLTAEPASVSQGGKSTLKWSVTNNPTMCTASDDWTGEKAKTSGTEQTQTLDKVQNYLFTLTCKTATGTGFKTVAVSVTAPNTSTPGSTSNTSTGVPAVSIAAKPNLIFSGDSSTITWEATNSPSACTASGDWSGTKAGSGSMSTGALTIAKTYTYTLICKNTSGSSQAISAKLTVQAVPPGSPIVFLSSTPTGPIPPGASVVLSWTTENSPTSCTASGDWSGGKTVGGGSQTISNLSVIKEYVFTMTCSNETGTISDAATVQVLPSAPNVSLTVNPSGILSGQSATISWSATNSPTSCTASGSWSGSQSATGSTSLSPASAGVFTYSLSCSNAAGAGSNSANLTVIATPTVSVSVAPGTITAGSNTTVSWTTGNSPSSCTAGGSGWSGSKAVGGGSQTVTFGTAGTFTFTLSCSNAGGSTTSNTASVTVNPAVYCAGQTPCYSTADLNAHTSLTDCWAYNTSTASSTNKSVYNITNFNNGWHKSRQNLLPAASTATALCGAKDFASFIAGTTLTGVGSRNHLTNTKQNTNSTLNAYRAGYYDATKP